MAKKNDPWSAQRWAVNAVTLGGAELPGGDDANFRGIDERPDTRGLEEVSTPMYTGNAAAWEFAGSPEERQGYLDLYGNAAGAAGQRQSPEMLAAQVQRQREEEFRNQQMQSMAQLYRRAEGSGPTSQAEQMAIDQGAAGSRAATAMAASARGATGSSALRGATNQQALSGIQGAQQQNLIRNQEQQQAQQLLGALTGQVRGQDINLATSNAQFGQQADLANQAAGIDQQAMNDKMVKFYTDMGMSVQEAQLRAQTERQKMLSDIVQQQYNAQAGIVTQDIQNASREEAARAAAAAAALQTGVSAFSD